MFYACMCVCVCVCVCGVLCVCVCICIIIFLCFFAFVDPVFEELGTLTDLSCCFHYNIFFLPFINCNIHHSLIIAALHIHNEEHCGWST